MCGRFAQTIDLKTAVDLFIENEAYSPFDSNYNCAPGQIIGAVLNDGVIKYKPFKWGLTTEWSIHSKFKLINIRSETLLTKKTFLKLYANNRCLVPADGFYEWKKLDNKKIPYFIYHKDKSPLFIAGIWNKWIDNSEKEIDSCSILTTEANAMITPIHNRMPVIIEKDYLKVWLDTGNFNKQVLQSLLKPYPAELMQYHRVSTKVNRITFDNPLLIEPVMTDESLF